MQHNTSRVSRHCKSAAAKAFALIEQRAAARVIVLNAIREALVTTCRISTNRVVAVGLGEEQLHDPANPAGAVNRRVQLIAIGKRH